MPTPIGTMRTFPARFQGVCDECHQTIKPGQMISWIKRGGRGQNTACHTDCKNPDAGAKQPQPETAELKPPAEVKLPEGVSNEDLVKAIQNILEDYVTEDQAKVLIKENSLGQKAIERIVEEAVAKAKPLHIEIANPATKEIQEIENAHYNMPKLLYLVSKRHHVYLWGDPGSGKSTGAEMVAKALSLPYGYIALNPQTPDSRLLGYMDAVGNYRETVFYKLYKEGGVFCIDEGDNSSASLLTTLNGMLEGHLGSFPIGMVERHPDFVVVMTGNTVGKGANPMFPDRRPFDAAFGERFTFLEWQYDTRLEQHVTFSINNDVKAEQWLTWVRAVRAFCKKNYPKVLVSPRASFKGAEYLKDSVLSMADIAEMIIFKGLDTGTKETILKNCPIPGNIVTAPEDNIQPTRQWNASDDEQVRTYLRQNRLIEAIKYRRQVTGDHLVDAKKYVERMR